MNTWVKAHSTGHDHGPHLILVWRILVIFSQRWNTYISIIHRENTIQGQNAWMVVKGTKGQRHMWINPAAKWLSEWVSDWMNDLLTDWSWLHELGFYALLASKVILHGKNSYSYRGCKSRGETREMTWKVVTGNDLRRSDCVATSQFPIASTLDNEPLFKYRSFLNRYIINKHTNKDISLMRLSFVQRKYIKFDVW